MFAGTATSIIFGLGRFRLFINADIFVSRSHLKPRIVAFLLADRTDRVAFVVVRRKDQRLIRQFEHSIEQAVILRASVAVLEVGSAGTADQKRVAGENAIRHTETE